MWLKNISGPRNFEDNNFFGGEGESGSKKIIWLSNLISEHGNTQLICTKNCHKDCKISKNTFCSKKNVVAWKKNMPYAKTTFL